MHGNIYEWCVDWYNSNYTYYRLIYGSGPVTDPQGPSKGSQNYHRLRGGSFYFGRTMCRSAARQYNLASSDNVHYGFRIAYLPSPSESLD